MFGWFRDEAARASLSNRVRSSAFGVLFPENLQGDVAPEPAVARAVNLSHAPAPQRSHDLVGTESGSRGQDHRSLRLPLFLASIHVRA